MLPRFTSLRRTSEPGALAVTRATAKAHLRVSHTSEDDLLDAYIAAAVGYVEEYTRRALITQSWTTKLRGFPGRTIELPRPPAASLTSFTYIDPDGASQTVGASLYTFDSASEPGAIRLDPDEDWPDVDDGDNTVTIVWSCGYGASETSVPAPIRSAILLMVGHLYENREAVNVGNIVTEYPLAVGPLLSPYRMIEV